MSKTVIPEGMVLVRVFEYDISLSSSPNSFLPPVDRERTDYMDVAVRGDEPLDLVRGRGPVNALLLSLRPVDQTASGWQASDKSTVPTGGRFTIARRGEAPGEVTRLMTGRNSILYQACGSWKEARDHAV